MSNNGEALAITEIKPYTELGLTRTFLNLAKQLATLNDELKPKEKHKKQLSYLLKVEMSQAVLETELQGDEDDLKPIFLVAAETGQAQCSFGGNMKVVMAKRSRKSIDEGLLRTNLFAAGLAFDTIDAIVEAATKVAEFAELEVREMTAKDKGEALPTITLADAKKIAAAKQRASLNP